MKLSARSKTTGFANFAWILLVFSALVLVNLIASKAPQRMDLTRSNRYTLAAPSIEISENLPGPVKVELYFTTDLPPSFEQMQRDITDLLTDYSSYSNGLLQFEFVDPRGSDSDAARAESFGVPEWPMQINSEDELTVRNASTGAVFIYESEEGERFKVIDRLLPGGNYEYELTRSLRDVTTESDLPRLGILIGDGGFIDPFLNAPFNPQNPVDPQQIRDQLSTQLSSFFEDLYRFDFVDISDPNTPFPEDLAGLFIIGPKSQFDDDMLYRLDQFIMSGRPLALFVSPYRMETQNFDQPGFPSIDLPGPNETGLERLLEGYGIQLNRDIVFEADVTNSQISVERFEINMGGRVAGSTYVPTPDPRLPLITDISRTSLLVPQMGVFGFLPGNRARPLGQSSLTLTPEAMSAELEESLDVDIVFQTSSSSYRYADPSGTARQSVDKEALSPFLLAFENNPEAPEIELEQGPFPLALTMVGQMNSAFPENEEDEHVSQTAEGRLFVVSNGEWVQALLAGQDPLLNPNTMGLLPPGAVQQVRSYLQNSEVLFRNTADWLAQNTDLVRIRVRDEPALLDLEGLDEGDQTRTKLFNIAGIPALFCLLGLYGLSVRRKRRKSLARKYASTD